MKKIIERPYKPEKLKRVIYYRGVELRDRDLPALAAEQRAPIERIDPCVLLYLTRAVALEVRDWDARALLWWLGSDRPWVIEAEIEAVRDEVARLAGSCLQSHPAPAVLMPLYAA